MDLDLKEKGILILYKFLFNKDYKPSKSMNNHNNIQAAFHLCDTLWIPLVEEYGFMWDLNGPSSILLEENLDKLDKKEEQIKAFYASPDISIEDLWYRAQIKKLIAIQFFLHCDDDRNFINILSCLQYLRTNQALVEFDRSLRELHRRLPKYNNIELLEKAWGCLLLLDIINFNDYDKFKDLNMLVRRRYKKNSHM